MAYKDPFRREITSPMRAFKIRGSGPPTRRTYYFSATGSDAASGLSPTAAKQTIAAANALTLNAGDTIAFNGGDSFAGNLIAPRSNITITSYGTGRATITHAINTKGITVQKSGVTVSNLIVTGAGGNFVTTNTVSWGISAYLEAGTDTITGINISGCLVTGSRIGILYGTDSQTRLMTDCTVTNNEVSGCADGIYGYGDYTIPRTAPFGMTNGIVYGNYTHDNTTNGIIIGGHSGGIVRLNYVYQNGGNSAYQGPTGIILYNSDGVTVDYNECHGTLISATVFDGIGLDIENCSSILVQFNYTHDNGGPGLMMFNYAGGGGSSNCTFRYNISVSDAASTLSEGSFRNGKNGANSETTGLAVYNNVFYQTRLTLACLRLEDTTATGFISSNICYVTGTAVIKSGLGGAALTTNKNCMFGAASYGTNAVTSDPLLTSVGSKPTFGWNAFAASGLNGWRLSTGSPCLNTGEGILATYGKAIGEADFFVNSIAALPTNIGAYDGAGL